MKATRGVSASLFGLVLGAFLLPWFHVSCGGERVATVTGRELVTGITDDDKKDLSSQPWAVLGLGLAAIGLLAAVAGGWGVVRAKVMVLLAALAAAAVVLTRWQLERLIHSETAGTGPRSPVALEGATGFWLAVGGLATVILVNLLTLTQENAQRRSAAVGDTPVDSSG